MTVAHWRGPLQLGGLFNRIVSTQILIVENDAVTALDLEGLLFEADYALTGIAASANQALQLVERSPPDLVLLDIGLSGSVDGIELARRLQEMFSLAHVYATGHIEPDVLVRAKRTDPLGFVAKPFCDTELLVGVEIALCRSRNYCRAASDSSVPTPFVVDRHFPLLQSIGTPGGPCRMELQCSSHLGKDDWAEGHSLAMPEMKVRSGLAKPQSAALATTSWRPE